MYLKELYRQNKAWFLLVILFAAGQLFLDYKQGIECSPFYHYNMFSGPYHFIPQYAVTGVSVDGKPLQPGDFSPNGWDNIVMPVALYRNESAWNQSLYRQTIRRFLPQPDSALYTNRLSRDEFDRWYRQRIRRLLNLPGTARIQYQVTPYPQHYFLSGQ